MSHKLLLRTFVARGGGRLGPSRAATNRRHSHHLTATSIRTFSSASSSSFLLSEHLQRLPGGSPSHFGCEIVDFDLSTISSSSSSPSQQQQQQQLANEIKSLLYENGVLVFRNQEHLTPEQELNFAKLFTHHQTDDSNQSYTGGAGTQHRLPDHPQIALVGSYKVHDFYGLTAESAGVYNNWHPDQRAWHCDGLADTHPPPDLTTMRCLQTPTKGGETLFACSVKAAELLPSANLEDKYGISPEDVIVNYRLFDKYEIAREGTHLLSGSGYKGQSDAAWDVNLTEGTSVPLMIRERHTGKRSLVGSYHVASISCIGDEPDAPPRLGFEDANAYMSEVWKVGVAEDQIYKHQWQVGDLVAWSNRLVIHTATSTSAYKGEDRLHTRIRMRSKQEDAPLAWKS